MRKLLCIILIMSMSIEVANTQNKTGKFNSTLRIEQYESISVYPLTFEFSSTDVDGYNITKNLTVDKAILIYKMDEFISFTLKSKSGAEITFEVEKVISEDNFGKTFWIDRSERYFVVITFSSEDEMDIRFVSNIDGSIMFYFPFEKVLKKRN